MSDLLGYTCTTCGLHCDREAHGPTLTAARLCADCHGDAAEFVAAVNARLTAYIGFPTTWEDLVGDWPESDMARKGDVEAAVQWILAECGH